MTGRALAKNTPNLHGPAALPTDRRPVCVGCHHPIAEGEGRFRVALTSLHVRCYDGIKATTERRHRTDPFRF